MIKRVAGSEYRRCWRCRVYIDEIAEIVRILSHGEANVQLEVPGYELESADELSELGARRPKSLDIRRRTDPWVTVSLDGSSASIGTLEATPEALGMLAQVEQVMKRSRRWSAIVLGGYPTVVALGGAVSWSLQEGISSKSGSGMALASLVTLVLSLAWVVAAVFVSVTRHSLIVPARRADFPPFWSRNRDALAVGVVCALVGAVVGAAAAKLI